MPSTWINLENVLNKILSQYCFYACYMKYPSDILEAENRPTIAHIQGSKESGEQFLVDWIVVGEFYFADDD